MGAAAEAIRPTGSAAEAVQPTGVVVRVRPMGAAAEQIESLPFVDPLEMEARMKRARAFALGIAME